MEFPPLPLLEPNHRLENSTKLFEGEVLGPESLAYNEVDGKVYTGLMDGRIVRFSASGKRQLEPFFRFNNDCADYSGPYQQYSEEQESQCQRPLGLKFDEKFEFLYFAYTGGIARIRVSDVKFEQLASECSGKRIYLANQIDIDEEKSVLYFTDSSDRWGRSRIISEILSGRSCGRVCALDLTTNHATQLVGSLPLTNGIALSHDKSTLFFVAGGTRVMAYHIPTASTQTLLDNLPGIGDNLTPRRHAKNRTNRPHYLLAAASKRAQPFSLTDAIAPYPWVRTLLYTLLPQATVVGLIPRVGLVMELDLDTAGPEGQGSEDARLVRTYQDRSSSPVHLLSEVTEFDGYWLVGSWYHNYVLEVSVRDEGGD